MNTHIYAQVPMHMCRYSYISTFLIIFKDRNIPKFCSCLHLVLNKLSFTSNKNYKIVFDSI